MPNKNRICTTLVVAGLLLLQLACQTLTGSRPTQPAPTARVTPSVAPLPTTARPVATSVPVATLSSAPGQACVGSLGYGITCIENNEWVNYSKNNVTLGSDYIKDIAICPGGEMLVLHSMGLNLFDGTQWRNYGQGWGYGSAEAVACATDNDFWVAHYEGASRFHDGIWQTYTMK